MTIGRLERCATSWEELTGAAACWRAGAACSAATAPAVTIAAAASPATAFVASAPPPAGKRPPATPAPPRGTTRRAAQLGEALGHLAELQADLRAAEAARLGRLGERDACAHEQ